MMVSFGMASPLTLILNLSWTLEVDAFDNISRNGNAHPQNPDLNPDCRWTLDVMKWMGAAQSGEQALAKLIREVFSSVTFFPDLTLAALNLVLISARTLTLAVSLTLSFI